jgi:hypothetical protein
MPPDPDPTPVEPDPIDVTDVPAPGEPSIPATPYASDGSPQGFPTHLVGKPRAPAGGFLKPGSDPLKPWVNPHPKAKPESS